MSIIHGLKNFFAFRGNVSRLNFFCLICVIELFRIIIINTYSHLPLSECRLFGFLADFTLMALVLYFYAIAIAGRLNNLKINPCVTYFGVLSIWFCKYVFLPLAHSANNMQIVYSGGILFVMILLPLFAKDKTTLLLKKIAD